MIIVKPLGGLGNRLRVLNSAYHLAQKNNEKKVFVLWEKDLNLNADFQNIFLPVKEFCFIKKSYSLNYFLIYKNKKFIFTFDYFKKIILSILTHGFIYIDDNTIKNKSMLQNLSLFKNIILNTCYPIYDYSIETNHYKIFKPTHRIRSKINNILVKINASCYFGVHIRRSDNIKSISESKTDSFKEIIFNEIKKNNKIYFYLATDDEATNSEFFNLFRDNIKLFDKKDFRRDTLEGIEDAVVDLFILSKASKIYGSYWSSFSEISSYFNNIPLYIVK